jgi:hypothetical protein
MSIRTFRYLAALVVVLALALRVFYTLDVRAPSDIRGDINDYVSYAWNLKQFGVFSSVPPGLEDVRPDSYRGPGYPLFLAAIMSAVGPFRMELHQTDSGLLQLVAQPSTWIFLVYLAQSLLGALTVALGMLLARFWISRGLSLAVGVLIAFWPHLIVFCATLLGETLFGFLLVAALVAACFSEQRRSMSIAVAAGALFGLAYLVNPVIGAFPMLVGVLFAFRGLIKPAVLLVAIFALAPLGWSIRNHTADVGERTSLMRAEQNFVEGSWPQYHVALNSRFSNEISAQIVKAIADEERAFTDDPSKGLSDMRSRMGDDPSYYLAWYLFDKPVLLWDWGIRVGATDIAFLQTTRDPFEGAVFLRLTKAAFRLLNPLLLILAVAGVVIVLARLPRRDTVRPFAALLCAWFFLYVTAVHDIFQAEPRYAIPYRAVQVVLAVSSLAFVAAVIAGRRTVAASS